MKFLYIITLTTLFIAFTSAQDVDEGNGSEVVDAPEDNESDASISYSVGSNKEDFGLVEHGGEDLILVKKTVDGHLTTEYFTVVDVDVKSNSEDGQNDEDASAINEDASAIDEEASAIDEEAPAIDEEFFENYFANLENLD